jgi:hypothetical protein
MQLIFSNTKKNHLNSLEMLWFFSFFYHFFPFNIEISKIYIDFFLPITFLEIFIRQLINICEQKHKGYFRNHSLIIIIIIKNLANVRCGVFKMWKMSHLTMFLHFCNNDQALNLDMSICTHSFNNYFQRMMSCNKLQWWKKVIPFSFCFSIKLCDTKSKFKGVMMADETS